MKKLLALFLFLGAFASFVGSGVAEITESGCEHPLLTSSTIGRKKKSVSV